VLQDGSDQDLIELRVIQFGRLSGFRRAE